MLSPPRSGSTLLRVMLGGHPRLFAPPELELLSFNTLAERRDAFSGRDSFWLEGRSARRHGGPGLRRRGGQGLLDGYAGAEGCTTRALLPPAPGVLGGAHAGRQDPVLRPRPGGAAAGRGGLFEEPLYIHLLRHPYGMIRSFEEARLDQVFFRRRTRSPAASWPS